MSKLINRVKWLLILSGIASIGLNFANPKLAKESIQTIAGGVKAATEVKKHNPLAGLPTEDAEKLYVQIEGKLYEYNKSNVYMVNGVRTLYKNGNPRTRLQIERERLEAEARLASDERTAAAMPKTQEVTQMLENQPHMAYTPGGVQKIMDAAREAKAKIEERTQELKQLDE